MKKYHRFWVWILAVLMMEAVGVSIAQAQGILVSEGELRLPRPDIIIIRPPEPPFPPMPPRPPRPPRPIPQPTLEYKISQIDVNAKITDQVAEVQYKSIKSPTLYLRPG